VVVAAAAVEGAGGDEAALLELRMRRLSTGTVGYADEASLLTPVSPRPMPRARGSRGEGGGNGGGGGGLKRPDGPKPPDFDSSHAVVALDGAVSVGACSRGGQLSTTWKKENQDAYICRALIPEERGGAGASQSRAAGGQASSSSNNDGAGRGLVLGVFDGHGVHGRYVSTLVRDLMAEAVTREGASVAADPEAVFSRIFAAVDGELKRTTQRGLNLSGTTALLACISAGQLSVAWAGDSACVVARAYVPGESESEESEGEEEEMRDDEGGDKPKRGVGVKLGGGRRGERERASGAAAAPVKEVARGPMTGAEPSLRAVRLTRDHKPGEPEERMRILASNGRVDRIVVEGGEREGPERLFLKFAWTPGLSCSRSFGDTLGHEVGMVSSPEVTTYDVDSEDRFVVLGSDGIWDFLSDERVVEVAHEALTREGGTPEAAAEAVVLAAQEQWRLKASTCDDVTCLIAKFQPSFAAKLRLRRLDSNASTTSSRSSIHTPGGD